MAVRLRLMRMGKKKQPTYRVVAADSSKARNGRFIEIVGTYNPRREPSLIEIDNERALHWLRHGAQPSERVQKLLVISGAWAEFTGVAGPVTEAGARPEKVTMAASAEEAEDAEEAVAEEAEDAEEAVAEEAEDAEEAVAEEAEDAEEAVAEEAAPVEETVSEKAEDAAPVEEAADETEKAEGGES